MKNRIIITLIVTVSTAIGIWLISVLGLFPFDQVKDSPVTKASPNPSTPVIINETQIKKGTEKTVKELVEQYRNLKVIDSHNHDASDSKYQNMLEVWKRNAVNQVVLFGDVSEPSAVMTDQMSWMAYKDNPDVIIPYFSGFDMHDKSSLDVVTHNLEQGYFGLGEIAAASLYSPVVSKVAWKGDSPMDGYLPDIYEICAKYKVPILLHIDPPNGMVIDKLEESLDKHPNTIIIFAHANAFNSPENIRKLLEKHPNLYADFYAGFTALNPASTNKLEDFVPVMKQFPDQFMLSTDSGFDIGEEAAIGAMYQLLDKLDDPKLARKIAHDNLDTIIRNQPATETQIAEIRKKSKETGQSYEWSHLSKVEAGQILWSK
ncbi:amidohydrolase family protein [Paenibacillus sp. LMG 31460]|uniref:Amidohydrolase family protein n=1 Tax=Paenibacillus germinis TaxID=2654979 RepID=A0ABX1Z2D4_9BACL|nr:amidohydrolase family protein [Paenibacillus germinis]NOU86060.1 amidohydrolase family protein [Paenibacillus germinis]